MKLPPLGGNCSELAQVFSIVARDQGEEPPESAEIAYEAIAPVYDHFTAHHDYDLWLAELMPKLEKHGIPGNRLLDVACGTGKSFLPMLERGWRVTACDISPAMVAIAREGRGPGGDLGVRHAPAAGVRRVRPRLLPRRRGQLPARRR
jgi:SAM-dependent methyltransferase